MYLIQFVFATDLRWSNSTILISKNDTFVFDFSYYWIEWGNYDVRTQKSNSPQVPSRFSYGVL